MHSFYKLSGKKRRRRHMETLQENRFFCTGLERKSFFSVIYVSFSITVMAGTKRREETNGIIFA